MIISFEKQNEAIAFCNRLVLFFLSNNIQTLLQILNTKKIVCTFATLMKHI